MAEAVVVPCWSLPWGVLGVKIILSGCGEGDCLEVGDGSRAADAFARPAQFMGALKHRIKP